VVPTAEQAAGERLVEDSLAGLLVRAASTHPDRTALVEGGVSLSFAELLEQATSFARTLVRLGVEPGTIVTVQLPTWWETEVVMYACQLAGAVYNPVVPIYREHELGFILRQARPGVLVVPGTYRGHDHLAMARSLCAALVQEGERPPQVVVVRPDTGADPLDRATAFGAVEEPRALPEPGVGDAVAVLLWTSGSTADPKGVLHSHRTLIHEARQVAAIARLDSGPPGHPGPSGDPVFMASPLTHVTGLVFGSVLPVDLGVAAVLLDRWDPGVAVDLVAEHGCVFTVSATTFLLAMTRVHEERATTSSLRVFICGGAEIGPELVRRATRVMGTRVVRCYGSTELPTFSIGDPYADPEAAAETDGQPVPGATWRTDPESGELLVRGSELFLGYLDAALDAEAFDPDGYFRTGDVVRIDARGARVVGRTKDIIIRGGENLSAIEIEDHLQQHPDVLDVAVVAAPDELLGERACAFVVAVEGAVLDLAALRTFLVGRGLALQKAPERLELVAELPRTPSGKVQKFKLRAAVARPSR